MTPAYSGFANLVRTRVGNGAEGEVAHDANAMFERQLKGHDEEIAQLKAQVVKAAKSAKKESTFSVRITELETKA